MTASPYNRPRGDQSNINRTSNASRLDGSRELWNVLYSLPRRKKVGVGYLVQCPCHKSGHETDGSLSIRQLVSGQILLHCFAGCQAEEVLHTLGFGMRDLYPADSSVRDRQPKHSYETFCDASGQTIAIKERIDRPNGTKSHIWYTAEGLKSHTKGLGGLRERDIPLYRLPELLATAEDVPVLFVEGGKACDAARAHGFTAVSLPGGASQHDFGEALKPLADRTVILWPDNDEPGRELMKAVASALVPIAKEVRWLDLADTSVAEKDDAFDYFAKTGTADKLKLMMDAVPAAYQTSSEDAPSAGEDREAIANSAANAEGEQAVERKSQATRLVEMALAEGCELFHTPEGQGYIRFHIAGHAENHPLQSKAAHLYLERLYYSETGAVPGSQGIQDALSVLCAKARYEGGEHQVYVRLAGHDDAIYIDCADKDWQVIKVTRAGWDIVTGNDVPVMFRRPRGILPLVTPERGGRLSKLREFVSLATDNDFLLLCGFLVGTLNPHGAQPILAFVGEQETGKSTDARIIKALVDPSVAVLRSQPRNIEDLMIGAANCRVLAFDNLSVIPDWLSDALCRISTGGALAKRELYSDAEEILLEAIRPVILSSIEEVMTRGDLIDRSISILLAEIREAKRRSEKALWAAFNSAAPGILGALLDAASTALRNLPDTKLEVLPRMADFTLWVTAAEEALGFESCAFVKAYMSSRADASNLVLDTEPVAIQLIAFMKRQADDEWKGTATELLTILNETLPERERKPDGWPKRANNLSGTLRRIAPALRKSAARLDIKFPQPTRTQRLIVIRKVSQNSVDSVDSVTYAQAEAMASSQNGESLSQNGRVSSHSYAQSGAGDDGDDDLHDVSSGTVDWEDIDDIPC